MEFLSQKLNLRMYQQTILGTASKYNTLVVIPTGMGKTHIALALAGLRFNLGKVLFLVPTKPLAFQQMKAFEPFFDAKENELIVMTGAIPPAQRKELWKQAKIVFATPQTVENDMLRRYLDLNEFKLIVLDEAHRCIGDYAGAWIAEQYKKVLDGRILALTASPASEKYKLDELRKALNIEKVEVRTTEDADVVDYVQGKDIKKIIIDLPKELIEIIQALENVLKKRLLALKDKEVIDTADPDKIRKLTLLELQKTLINKADTDSNNYLYVSLISECLKIQHALLLLQTQGVSPLIEFFKKMEKQAKTVKAAQRLINDWSFKRAMLLAYDFWGTQGEHPKFNVLRQLVEENKGEKMIIFTQYRSTVTRIVELLEDIPDIFPRRFIGQAKGMSQKEQIAAIQKFREGKYNVLVCTNVAEEGIDIPAVPVGIFFEPVPSALRSIQRRGRAGRTEFSTIYVLIAKGTIDEKYFWVAQRKEEQMNQILSDMKEEVSRQSNLDMFKVN